MDTCHGLRSKEASHEDLFFKGFLCSEAYGACFQGIVLSSSLHTVHGTPPSPTHPSPVPLLTSSKPSSTFLPLPPRSPGEYTCQGAGALSLGSRSPVLREQGTQTGLFCGAFCLHVPAGCKLERGSQCPFLIVLPIQAHSLLRIHTVGEGKGLGNKRVNRTMDRKGVHFLINMLAIQQLV